jgi:hypothetical protein
VRWLCFHDLSGVLGWSGVELVHVSTAVAFNVVDLDYDGYIEPREMHRFMSSLFTVLFHSVPNLADAVGMASTVVVGGRVCGCMKVRERHTHTQCVKTGRLCLWIVDVLTRRKLDVGCGAVHAGASADELAWATTLDCFQQADSNRDGLLSFDEFCTWYGTPSTLPFLHFLDDMRLPSPMGRHRSLVP